MRADGYTLLVTWPQFTGDHHRQDVWFAYVSDQAAAVKAVQNACGAMNDAKIEILGHMTSNSLQAHGVKKGAVREGPRLPDLSGGASVGKSPSCA